MTSVGILKDPQLTDNNTLVHMSVEMVDIRVVAMRLVDTVVLQGFKDKALLIEGIMEIIQIDHLIMTGIVDLDRYLLHPFFFGGTSSTFFKISLDK